MNIKTQKLFDEIHNIKTKLQLHQNKNGWNIYIEDAIEDCTELQNWMVVLSSEYGNSPYPDAIYNKIRNVLQNAKLYLSFLDEAT